MEFCTPYLLIILLILTQVATAQEGPGIVIAHPGQDVELLCTVTESSGSQTTGWLVNNEGPYRINAIRSGILTEYTATLDSSNLIVENVTINDSRNGSEYRCVIVPAQGMIALADIIDESDPTILYVAGIPSIVPAVTVNVNTINFNGNSVILILSWGEPFNNLDPIVNYTVSCSGDVTCPPNFTTTDNTTRSYTITNLTPMTNYTFSVVATNSIGSGEAGVVMITTLSGNIIIVATTSSVGMTTTTSSVGMTTSTSSVDMTTTTSSVGMSTIATSSVGMTTVTVTATVGMTDATTSGEGGDAITISIIVFGIVLIIVYCCLVFLFCYCCKKKARRYQDKEFCDVSRKSLIMNVILGVFTFGISIVVWYVYVKCKDNDKDDDEYCRIVHVTIIVLGIYTFGTSLLLWWLCTKLAKCCFSGVKDDPKGVSNKLAEREYVNKLADREYVNKLTKLEYDDEYEYEDVDIPRDPIHHSWNPQGNLYTNNNQRFASTKTNQRDSAPRQAAVDDARWPVSTTANQPSAETTAGGVPYAEFRGNPRSHGEMKNKKLKYADLDLDQPYENVEQPSTYKNVVRRETSVEYAYVQVT